MTFHLVDTETQGDAECRNDQGGALPPFGTAYAGYQMSFEVIGGFVPMFVSNLEAAYPVRVTKGPDSRVWVLDQGDASSVTRGRMFSVNPGNAVDGFSVVTIQ